MNPPKQDDYEYQERIAIRLQDIEHPTPAQVNTARMQALLEISARKKNAATKM